MTRTELTLSAFHKLSEAALADAKVRSQLFLTPEEEALVALPTGYATNIPTARLDSFFSRHDNGDFTLNFIEFNGESPPAWPITMCWRSYFWRRLCCNALASVIMSSRSRAGAMPWMLCYASIMSGVAPMASCPTSPLSIWAGVPTTSEFRLFVAYFARYGIHATICTPDELEFRNGQMVAAGRQVDFVYKRVLTTELLQRYGLKHPLFDAVRAGAICMVNPFNCKLLHKKASFAVASDERNAYLFDARGARGHPSAHSLDAHRRGSPHA